MKYLFFILFIVPTLLCGQDVLKYENISYRNTIQTVLLFRQGWELSYPIINLNTTEKLELSFDDLDKDIKNYCYTIIHCDADWQPSDVMPPDYIDGFVENKISDYRYSFNTIVNYTHYDIVFPNEDMKIKISGNYIILVYENFDQSQLVLSRRFSVVEPKVTITANIKRPTIVDLRDCCQEVDFSINHASYKISNPYEDLHIVVTQNNRWDNAIRELKPVYIKENELDYDFDGAENVFKGLNEFRFFNCQNVNFKAERVDSIYFEKPYTHFVLLPDFKPKRNNYLYHEDINGKRLIKIEMSNSSETEADYVMVHFRLPYDAPISYGNFYITGALSDWNYTNNNLMKYNYAHKSYELEMLLKQGYYNYTYTFVSNNTNQVDGTYTEGSFFETENDYLIYVYQNDYSVRYQKLICVYLGNSLKKF